MNYYERHIGDYIRDTVGLSMIEDGAYGRLLDQLYQTEKPLPLDRKEVYRMARATNTTERKAVDYVVGKFFERTDEGFVQKRAMEILAEYWDRPEQPEKKNTKEGNRERQRRSRERRKALFESLAGHGVVPPYNTPMKELEALLSRHQTQPVTPEKRDMSHAVTESVMAPVMGNHSPLTTNQEPKDIKPLSSRLDETPIPVGDDPPEAGEGSAAARVILQYLNERAGHSYKPVESNLRMIRGRLTEGATLDECCAVIDAKVAQWANDAKMAEYLRPATLFNATNYAQYAGQLSAAMAPKKLQVVL